MARAKKKVTPKPRSKNRTSSTALLAQNNQDIKQALKGKLSFGAAMHMLGGSGRPTSSRGRGGKGGGVSGAMWGKTPTDVVIRTIKGRKVPLGQGKKK
jgi:hypothetical protein